MLGGQSILIEKPHNKMCEHEECTEHAGNDSFNFSLPDFPYVKFSLKDGKWRFCQGIVFDCNILDDK